MQPFAPGLPEGVMTHPLLPLAARAVLSGLFLYVQIHRSKAIPGPQALADYLNVSVGEVDGAYRTLRDKGFLGKDDLGLYVARWGSKQLRIEIEEAKAPPPLPLPEAAAGARKPPAKDAKLPIKDRPPNATDVRKWMVRGIEKHIKTGVVYGPWHARENKLAKTLLEDYGPELVKAAVEYLCENWLSHFVAKKGKTGLPGIGFLWAWRESIFGRVQARFKSTKNGRKAEFNQSDPGKDEGF